MISQSQRRREKKKSSQTRTAHIQCMANLQNTAHKTQKCHSPFYATAGIVAYAHRSTNPIKLLGRLTEAIG